MKKNIRLGIALLLIAHAPGSAFAAGLSPLEQLGKRLFFDTNLSTPPGQSCASCHSPEVGFTGPNSAVNAGSAVMPGAVHSRAGNRKPPSAAYGGSSPKLNLDPVEEIWVGGMFWDGRATGLKLGDPLTEQAIGPFLNDLEMNMASAKQVIDRVALSDYAVLFRQVWGAASLDSKSDVSGTYERIGRSIAAFERSSEVSSFSSKYDYFLKGKVSLTPQEARGLSLFEGKAMCSGCHVSQPGPKGEAPLFTDFTYDNIGVPKNPLNPFYSAPTSVNRDGKNWVDQGLAGFLSGTGWVPKAVWETERGKQKVPTLRNVDKRPYPGFVKAYGHNGYFKSLEQIVHFYNTRDVATWPAPEVPVNVNVEELGNLGLSAQEEADIVAFLKTLSDGFKLP